MKTKFYLYLAGTVFKCKTCIILRVIIIISFFNICFVRVQSQPWTLKQCVDTALKNNLTIQQSANATAISEITLNQSKSNILPSLSGSIGQSYNFENSNNSNISLSGAVTLFNGFQNKNTIKQNQLDYQASKYDVETQKNNIVLNVIDAYLQVLYAEELVKKNPGRIQIIRHEKPNGIGVSFWDGVDHSTGDIVVMLPGDNENDPQETLRYFKLLEHVDIVIPFIFNKEARSLFRNALSYLFRFIINTTFLVNFNYTNGTVLYRKSILKDLPVRSSGFFFQTDILIRSVKKGYLFAEVPYKLGVRSRGVSKAVSFPSLLQVIRGYLRLVRDFYFKKQDKFENLLFSNDSQTASRRKG